MKTRLVVVGLMLAGLAGWVGACTPQPKLPCPIQTANPAAALPPFAVFYTLKSGTGLCATKTFEMYGFQKYNEPGTEETHVAVRPGDLGLHFEDGRSDPADPEGKKVNAIGDLPAEPGSDDLCALTFDDAHSNHAQQSFEAIPDEPLPDGGVSPGEPALSIKYEWTSLKFLSSPSVPGSAFFGELKYTEDGCTATYQAEGFWPLVSSPNDFASWGCDPTKYVNDDGSRDLPDGGMLEDLDCAAGQNAKFGHTLGSGVNPDFPVVCDPSFAAYAVDNAGLCVLGTRDRTTRAITRKSVEQDLTKLGK
jgi:hypothetical protein